MNNNGASRLLRHYKSSSTMFLRTYEFLIYADGHSEMRAYGKGGLQYVRTWEEPFTAMKMLVADRNQGFNIKQVDTKGDTNGE